MSPPPPAHAGQQEETAGLPLTGARVPWGRRGGTLGSFRSGGRPGPAGSARVGAKRERRPPWVRDSERRRSSHWAILLPPASPRRLPLPRTSLLRPALPVPPTPHPLDGPGPPLPTTTNVTWALCASIM